MADFIPTASPNRSLRVGIVTAIVAALIAGSVAYAYEQHKATATENDLQAQINSLKAQLAATPTPTPTPTPTETPSASPTVSPTPTASPTATPAATTYKTSALSLSIPAGWTASQVTGNLSAVNVTNGNYILYINVNASQASGVTGGRFAEIAQGAPSADAVIESWPSDPCGAPALTTIGKGPYYTNRADLYVNGSSDHCKAPRDDSTVWYFSYFTNSTGSNYFNDYKAGQNPGLVITMAYQGTDVNTLPQKGDATLNAMLSQMTSIAKSLTITGR